jgi:hypothetical protein
LAWPLSLSIAFGLLLLAGRRFGVVCPLASRFRILTLILRCVGTRGALIHVPIRPLANTCEKKGLKLASYRSNYDFRDEELK